MAREQEQVRWLLRTFAGVTEPDDPARWAPPSDPDAWVPPSARLAPHERDYLDRRRSAASRPDAPKVLPWERWVDLLTTVMRPYIQAAIRSEWLLGPKEEFVQVGRRADNAPRSWHPLDPAFLTSRWDSILCPIYLQLYEALRRLSEGKRAVRFCHECGEPFLMLDGRRQRFCSDPHRNRYNQRDFRERHSRT